MGTCHQCKLAFENFECTPRDIIYFPFDGCMDGISWLVEIV